MPHAPAPFRLSPFSDLVGVRLLDAAEGRSRATLEVGTTVRNRVGTVHGGAIFTLVDAAMGAAVKSALGADAPVVTRDASIRYLAPARDSPLTCTAEVSERDARGFTVTARVESGGVLVADATSHYVAIERRSMH